MGYEGFDCSFHQLIISLAIISKTSQTLQLQIYYLIGTSFYQLIISAIITKASQTLYTGLVHYIKMQQKMGDCSDFLFGSSYGGGRNTFFLRGICINRPVAIEEPLEYLILHRFVPWNSTASLAASLLFPVASTSSSTRSMGISRSFRTLSLAMNTLLLPTPRHRLCVNFTCACITSLISTTVVAN